LALEEKIMKRLIFAVIIILAFATYATQSVGQTAFSAAGVIESSTGGFKYPDGSVQLSAILPPCTAITYLPYSIFEEGVYCLTGNLATSLLSGNAITVSADNVVLDLNGWTLDGLGAGSDTATTGIYANQRKNITIRNGSIRGFLYGIALRDSEPYTNSQNHLIEHIRADQNTFRGMQVSGSNCEVRRNQVVNTGGSTEVGGIYVGLYLLGPNGRVLNNDVSNTVATTGNSVGGIHLGSASGGVVESNRISSVIGDGPTNYGIEIIRSDHVLVRDNSITSVGYGAYLIFSNDALVRANNISNADAGIYFNSATGKYRDNLTSGVTTPFTGGTDAGGND
jgi:hypothetical protein